MFITLIQILSLDLKEIYLKHTKAINLLDTNKGSHKLVASEPNVKKPGSIMFLKLSVCLDLKEWMWVLSLFLNVNLLCNEFVLDLSSNSNFFQYELILNFSFFG